MLLRQLSNAIMNQQKESYELVLNGIRLSGFHTENVERSCKHNHNRRKNIQQQ